MKSHLEKVLVEIISVITKEPFRKLMEENIMNVILTMMGTGVVQKELCIRMMA